MTNVVKFPNLGIQFTINRVMFSIGSLEIYWYGFIIAMAFLLAVWYGLRRCEKFGIEKDTIVDMLLITTPIAIIGARTYYVVFNFSEFEDNLWDVFKIWNGGIAIYGAIIFAVITALIFCKVKKLNTLNLFDLGALGLMIGQAIGRWGNFVNGEAYGVTVDGLPWGMVVQNNIHSTYGMMVHPIFLYESLWNAVGFIILHFVSKKRRFYGQIFFSYVAWYGLGRGLVEGIRGGDALLFFDTGIKVSQVLGYLSAIVALGILVYKFIFSDRGDTIELLTKEEIAQAKLAAVAASAGESTAETVEAAEPVETVEITETAENAENAEELPQPAEAEASADGPKEQTEENKEEENL